MNELKLPEYKRYFYLTFLISWLFWGILAVTRTPMTKMPGPIFYALAGAAPAISAVILIYRLKDKITIQDYWQRLYSLKRLGWKGAIFSLLCPPLMVIAAGFIDKLTGESAFSIEPQLQGNPIGFISLALFIFLFGPLTEEMGWRGYALDGLLSEHGILKASLLLGCLWALWHLPLFFIPESYQQSLTRMPALLVLFPVNILSQTFIMTWLYQITCHSTLSAVFFHFAVNYVGEIFQLSMTGEMILGLLWMLLAVFLMIEMKKDAT